MSERVHNKLVRDGIPGIIKKDGHTAVTRQLDDDDYRRALLDKLVEEAIELRDSDGSLEERADIAEVLVAFDELAGFMPESIESARQGKATKRGGFKNRIFLEKEIIND